MKIQTKAARRFLFVQAALLLVLCLFPLYRKLADAMPDRMMRCFLHDRLLLYCPLCGGTRALEELLRLHPVSAFQCNAYVTLVFFLAVAFEIWALIRLLRGKEKLLPLPEWFWVVMAILLVGYGVLRNWLMISFGYDPLGDFSLIWGQAVT